MPRFTREQENIIQADRGNLLVSAAAGSGKTTVMVERITERIRAGLVDVSGLLVLTFTEAAASNMKTKISKSLHEAIAASTDPKERQYLSRQALYLPYARISTIHSFCLSIVKEYAYLLNREEDGYDALDADFRTADQAEADELFNQAIEQVLREHYERLELIEDERQEAVESGEDLDGSVSPEEKLEADDFLLLLDSYAGSKNDDAIRSNITSIYRFLRSMPDYYDWVEKELVELEVSANDFDQSRSAMRLRDRLRRVMESMEDDFERFTDLLDDPETQLAAVKNPEETTVLIEACQRTLDQILEFREQLAADDLGFEAIAGYLKALQFPKIKRFAKHTNRNEIVDMIQHRFSAITGFYYPESSAPRGTMPAYAQSLQQIEADTRAMLPVLRSLFALVLKTDQRYGELKQEQAVIDFNDFEHLALALLRKKEVIESYVNQIQEIYVDEYQDTSSIQDTIIEAVSQNNVFVVGDVKQSIYRFRHARPEIFNGKMKLLQTNSERGQVLLMSQNFRSLAGILDAVNSIFERVMEEETGEIDYQDGHALRAFHQDDPANPQPVEFILIDGSANERIRTAALKDDLTDESKSSEEETDLDLIENEGRLIADIILKEKYGQGNPLAPKYSDITVLCMTHAHARSVSEQLRAYAYPVTGEEDTGYLATNELRLMEALIDLLGNELQDIPLLTCLRQLPVYGRFSDAELLEIKAFSLRERAETNPYEHFYLAVSYYEENGSDLELKSRLLRFRQWIHKLREAAVYLSLNELISLIYQDTGLLQAVTAEEEGEKRVTNLHQFQDWAGQFESKGRRGLAYFVLYLKEKRRQGSSVTAFEEPDPADNSIRVMTYHKSKGLEFPLVFMVGLHSKLIRSGGSGVKFVDLSERGGIAYQVRRPDQLLAYPSISTMAQKEEQDDAAFAESMRLLYVAMTRAEKKLYLMATLNRGLSNKNPHAASFQTKLLAWRKRNLGNEDRLAESGRIATYNRADLLQANNFADLIFMSQIAVQSDLVDFFSSGEAGSTSINNSWCYRILNSQQTWPFTDPQAVVVTEEESRSITEEEAAVSIDRSRYETILRSYQSEYPYRVSTQTPQKFAVSELKRRMQVAMFMQANEGNIDSYEQADGKQLDTLSSAGINTMLDSWLSDDWTAERKNKSVLSAAQRGTALHTALRFLDIDSVRGGTIRSAEAALQELHKQSVLRDNELDAVRPYADKLLAYANSPIAAKILDAESNGSVYREVPFTLAENIAAIIPNQDSISDDKILIQGIIDLWYSLNGESVLLDYKSDILRGSVNERSQILHDRYQLQLELYSRAIAAATGKVVKQRLIWSIPDARIYEIEEMDDLLK